MNRFIPLLLLLCVALGLDAQGRKLRAADKYAAPWGTSTAAGTLADPYDLATACLDSKLGNGDTLWLRGGAYKGPINCYHSGTSASRKAIKPYGTERPVIVDYARYGSGGIFDLSSSASYLDIEGLWVVNVNLNRAYTTSGNRRMGVEDQCYKCTFRNSYILNVGNGMGAWKENVEGVIAGNVIVNGGTYETGARGHGHGIYVQHDNQATPGYKSLVQNVILNQFGWGIHGYPNPGHMKGLLIQNNVIGENGRWQGSGVRYNQILIDAYWPYDACGILVDENSIRSDITTLGGNWRDAAIEFGPDGGAGEYGCGDMATTDNTIWGGDPQIDNYAAPYWNAYSVTGNTEVEVDGTGAPGSPTVNIYPNATNDDTATVAIFNWSAASSVAIDPSSILESSDGYEIRNLNCPSADPIASGTYSSGTISISFPLDVCAPWGYGSTTTDSEFAALLISPTWTEHEATELVGYYETAGGDVIEFYIDGGILYETDVNDSTLSRSGFTPVALDKITDQVYRLNDGSAEGVFAFHDFVSSEAQQVYLQWSAATLPLTRH